MQYRGEKLELFGGGRIGGRGSWAWVATAAEAIDTSIKLVKANFTLILITGT
jgi:hypothetical protein